MPHAHVTLKAVQDPNAEQDGELRSVTEDDVAKVRTVLARIASSLEQGAGGKYRFRRFRDVEWLTTQAIAPGATMPIPERRRLLGKAMRNRAFRLSTTNKMASHWVLEIASVVAFVCYWLWLRMRYSGRVPGVSGRYRWFYRQDFLAPEMGDNFIDLADRLTEDRRGGEEQTQVLLLMVHAFLEDLRSAYRRRLFGRVRAFNAVVLLSGITRRNGGYRLLQAINSVRNQTGLLDPLLLVTSSKKVPPRAEPVDADRQLVPGNGDPIEPWSVELLDRWRRRDASAWYLSIPIADVDQRGAARQPAPLVLPRPGFWRRRRTRRAVAAALVVAAVATYAWYGNRQDHATCGDGFTWIDFRAGGSAGTARRIDGECVGITDGSNTKLVPDSKLFTAALEKVVELNQEVDRRGSIQPGRPVITLAFLAALTPGAGSAASDQLPAEAEQLAGLVVAQKQQLDKSQDSDPLVKLLVANAGRNARHGAWVAGKIGDLAERDPTLVAAVGLNESRASTAEMIKILAGRGIPVVAATLSADSLADENRMYFQVSPQNRRQAAVALAYAESLVDSGFEFNGHRLGRKARIHYSDDGTDIYSQNLAADLHAAFTAASFDVERVTFTPTGELSRSSPADPAVRRLAESKDAGRDACDLLDGFVLYVGRPLPDFQGFLSGTSDQCRTDPPFILGGDDVTRYVANDKAREANRAVPFQYLSFAVAPQLDRGPSREPSPEAVDFYNQLETLFPGTRNVAALDGHAALTYDAAETVITAVSYLSTPAGRVKVTGGSVWAALPSVTNSGNSHHYLGVTGAIDFGGLTNRRVPLNKPIAILEVKSGKPTAEAGLYCGGRSDTRTQSWCPFDD